MSPEQLRAAYLAHVHKQPPMDAGGHPSMALQERVGDEWARWEQVRVGLWTLLADTLADEFVNEAKGAES